MIAMELKSDFVEKQPGNSNEYGANDIGSGRKVGHLIEVLTVEAEKSTAEEILEMRGKVNMVGINTSKVVNMTMVNIRRMLNPEIGNKKAVDTKMKAFREVMIEPIIRETMNTTSKVRVMTETFTEEEAEIKIQEAEVFITKTRIIYKRINIGKMICLRKAVDIMMNTEEKIEEVETTEKRELPTMIGTIKVDTVRKEEMIVEDIQKSKIIMIEIRIKVEVGETMIATVRTMIIIKETLREGQNIQSNTMISKVIVEEEYLTSLEKEAMVKFMPMEKMITANITEATILVMKATMTTRRILIIVSMVSLTRSILTVDITTMIRAIQLEE